ncbi:translation elongation factor Ts [Anaplasma capra]|uniref:translation elongation factor Ts n=1 Tax=Anaplasma capra TaxID=1562740 RepID=UPI0021D5F7B4|nr:translation elongation factor Ts [Anaplasma capra]MCU7611559.1 translation elongation factor Ts [Anaplasma capra]MCU7612002.1 translation elongation factor Ts [Anaplasma capra]
MKVGVEIIKELRQITGAGLGDCKEALEACSGDLEKAKGYLRERGLSKAYKKSHRDAADGLVAIRVEGNRGAILKLGSETDFVARNEKFRFLISQLVGSLLKYGSEDLSGFSSSPCEGVPGVSIADEVLNAAAVLGENVVLSGIGFLELGSSGVIGSYVHGAVADGVGRSGAIVSLETTAATQSGELLEFAKQLAMHVVAAKPESLSVETLGGELVEREREIVAKQVEALGKPESVASKIVEGRMQKFFEDMVLLEQTFVVDGQTKIRDLLSKKSQDLGCEVRLTAYRMLSIG